VLVHGASGGVGTVAIQIARLLGMEVDATSSARNLALCRDLGAARAWDYASGALAQANPHFDVVFDVFGNLRFDEARSWLAPRGVFVSTIATPGRVARDLLLRFRPIRERFVAVRGRRPDLEQIGAWVKSGELRAVIDSVFPADRVHDAFRLLESKRARGKIVVEVSAIGR
jgi:alcohol dehydrogenase